MLSLQECFSTDGAHQSRGDLTCWFTPDLSIQPSLVRVDYNCWQLPHLLQTTLHWSWCNRPFIKPDLNQVPDFKMATAPTVTNVPDSKMATSTNIKDVPYSRMATVLTISNIVLQICANGKNIIFRGPQMVSLLWHSPFLRNRVRKSIDDGNTKTIINLPKDMIENIDIIYILSGRPNDSRYYVLPEVFERIDLVKFLHLSSYLIIDDAFVLHMLKNFSFANNSSIIPALYCAKYRMDYPEVASKLALDLGIRPHKLPNKSNYRDHYKRVRRMVKSDRRYNSSPNFNWEYWPHYAICGCDRCHDVMSAAGNQPRMPAFSHTFPSHGKCPICPQANRLHVFNRPSP